MTAFTTGGNFEYIKHAYLEIHFKLFKGYLHSLFSRDVFGP